MIGCIYTFDCPVHGKEVGAVCFRAANEENRDRWKKLVLTYTFVPFDEGELDKVLNNLTATGGNTKE